MRRPIRLGLAGLHSPQPPPVMGPKFRGPVPFKFGISSPPFSNLNKLLICFYSTVQQFSILIRPISAVTMINTVTFFHVLLISSQEKVYLFACPMQILSPHPEHLVASVG